MNTNPSLVAGRTRLPAAVLGSAAIALALGALAQPAVSPAEDNEWDVGAYDSCMKSAVVPAPDR